jgi:hypothetical protein
MRSPPSLSTSSAISTRHLGIDWLRIGAFSLLILYHVMMVFLPGHWLVKSDELVPAVKWPMIALEPWRLPLLFLVSGYASRALFGRIGEPGAFLAARSYRLLLPLAFATLFLIPPQTWIGLVANHGYDGSFLHFWTSDWLSFRMMHGTELPNPEHLWFVLYLWLYTLLLTLAVAALPASAKRRLAAMVAALEPGLRMLWVPLAGLLAMRLSLLFTVPESHHLLDNWAGHSLYLPFFLAGFGLAAAPALWRSIRRAAPAAALLAAASFSAIFYFEAYYALVPFTHVQKVVERSSEVAAAWSVTLLLLALADRWLQRDRPVRRLLSEAVFPCYIVHQTIIVLTAWELRGSGYPAWVQACAILAATIAGCWLFYLSARRAGPLRPYLGLSAAPVAGVETRPSSPPPKGRPLSAR